MTDECRQGQKRYQPVDKLLLFLDEAEVCCGMVPQAQGFAVTSFTKKEGAM